MVARIRSGKSVKGAINYNETKVKQGKASLIGTINYPKEPDQLKFHEKLNRLQLLTNLNTRAETNCLHVSLNFDPSEKLTTETLNKIAASYMEKIGFGNQPYLIYEHNDAAHQHIHIVSTNIQKDGKRIALHNLGRTKSEIARKEIEVSFGLVRAGDKQKKDLRPLRPVNLEKATYGKEETRRAIANIVTQVIAQYKFCSIPEFNAVLQQYNVIADRGPEDSRMFQNKGLLYSLMDANGKKIGVPIKASDIYEKPTIANLEKRFEKNEKLKDQHKKAVKAAVQMAMKLSRDQNSFTAKLNAYKLDVVYRTNQQGYLYGVTFVDHQTKTVFNGSDLGKEFSAAALREKWAEGKSATKGVQPYHNQQTQNVNEPVKGTDKTAILETITDSDPNFNYLPKALKRKRRKPKKRI